MARTHQPSGQTTPLGEVVEKTAPLDGADANAPSGLPHPDWDRYQILGFLGEGGMGRVYKGYDPRLRRQVALKFLGRESQAGRFAREARLQASLDHPAICKVYEVGEVAGDRYIAMQLISGPTLSAARPSLSPGEKLQIVEDVARGVHAAHLAGLIHRDIKPSNVMIERAAGMRWRAYIMDFGIAREVAVPGATATGEMLGTPAYMAPEQAAGRREHDPRTDVYGLGATLFFLLTGRPPFEGTLAEVLSQLSQGDPPSLRSLAAGAPAELETIVARCLERDPARRYPSAEALAEDLRRHREGEPIEARRPTLVARARRVARKRRAALLVTAVALAGGVGAAGVWWQGRASADRRARTAARFGREAERTRGELRRAYTLPRHDVRPEKAAVAARLEELAREIDALGDVAVGPGEYAVGSGYLDLRDFERARAHLERAWAAGAREPEAAYALGQSLGGLYQRELALVERIGNAGERERRRAEIQARLRDPALRYLRLGGGAGEDAAFAEAEIAYYERRWDDALAAARQAASRTSWLYGARLVEGDVLLSRATESWRARDTAAAQGLAEQALAAYSAAAEFGRSDASVHTRVCASLGWVVQLASRRGASPDDAEQRAVEACDAAIAVDADQPDAYYEKSRVLFVWAQFLSMRGRDARPLLDEVEALAQEALRRDPRHIDAIANVGRARMLRATLMQRGGQDPRREIDRALEMFEKGLALEPRSLDLHNAVGIAYGLRGQMESKLGLDPRPSMARAAEAYGRELAIVPDDSMVKMNMASLDAERGEYELEHGIDPTASLAASVRVLESLPKKDVVALDNLAVTEASRARWAHATGADPLPAIARARAAFERAAADNPRDFETLSHWAAAEAARASYLLETGADPTEALSVGRASAERALAVKPTGGDPRIALVALETVAARFAAARGASPAPFFAAADAALARGGNDVTGMQLAIAELHRRRAEWLLATRRPAAPAVAAGLAAASRAGGSARAVLLTGALQLLDARARRDRARAAEAAATLARAVDMNRPLLEREAAPLLAEAGKLAR